MAEPDHETVAEVKSLHIYTLVLTKSSHFFFKLFNNGMKEQHRDVVTLRICQKEEVPLLDTLRFMYSYKLRATTALDLLQVLMVADKFGIDSCVNFCTQQLQTAPLSVEYAILCLEVDSNLFIGGLIKPLLDPAKEYILARSKELFRYKRDALSLPLSAVKVVLSSDDLRVPSEDSVFNFILEWSLEHQSEPEELTECLKLLRFPYLSYAVLREISDTYDQEDLNDLVLKARSFKATGVAQCNFPPRDYTWGKFTCLNI